MITITRRLEWLTLVAAVCCAAVEARASCVETFETGKQPLAEIHVATTGNGSAGSPFATIERAAQAALPGTAIRVHAGTYAGGLFVGDLAGTLAAPIWVGGAPGEARPQPARGRNERDRQPGPALPRPGGR